MPSKTDPLKSFRFLVEIEASGKKIAAAFSQFSGVKMRLETVAVRSGSEHRGVLDCIPSLTSYENITLTKGVIGDNEFLDWLLAATPSVTEAPSGKDLCRNISVVALDDTGKRAVTWILADAIPVGYELSPMDGSQNAILSEALEFTIAGFERETHSPPIGI